jgi:hypothetical protein
MLKASVFDTLKDLELSEDEARLLEASRNFRNDPDDAKKLAAFIAASKKFKKHPFWLVLIQCQCHECSSYKE